MRPQQGRGRRNDEDGSPFLSRVRRRGADRVSRDSVDQQDLSADAKALPDGDPRARRVLNQQLLAGSRERLLPRSAPRARSASRPSSAPAPRSVEPPR